MLDDCFRFAPRDSIPGLIAKICKYLKEHPGWSEKELEEQIKKFISATGVESFNGRIGNVTLDKNDVNNLKIASAYFAEGDESIDSLDLVSLYNQGVRFVFTDFNSVISGYNLAFVLDYFDASGEVVYYPVSTGSGGGGNIVSVNGKTGEVNLKVVDVSNGNSPDENAYIFIDEDEEYPEVIATDSAKLGGQLPEHYATAQSVNDLKGDLADKISYITPEMFGAKGNGIYDDTSAIQQAINSMSELDTIIFNKTYKISDTIILKSGIIIDGFGKIIMQRNVNKPSLYLNVGSITIKNINLDSTGNIFGYLKGEILLGDNVGEIRNTIVDNVKIITEYNSENIEATGIFINNASFTKVTNCFVNGVICFNNSSVDGHCEISSNIVLPTNIFNQAISIGCDYGVICKNIVYGTKSIGIAVGGGVENKIIDNTIFTICDSSRSSKNGNGFGMSINPYTTGLIISGNHIECDTTLSNNDKDYYGIELLGSKNTLITNNYLKNTGGIVVNGNSEDRICENVVIGNNIIDGGLGISIMRYTNDITISNNHVKVDRNFIGSVYSNGISFSYVDDENFNNRYKVLGNKIHMKHNGNGIYLEGSKNTFIAENNIVFNSDLEGICIRLIKHTGIGVDIVNNICEQIGTSKTVNGIDSYDEQIHLNTRIFGNKFVNLNYCIKINPDSFYLDKVMIFNNKSENCKVFSTVGICLYDYSPHTGVYLGKLINNRYGQPISIIGTNQTWARGTIIYCEFSDDADLGIDGSKYIVIGYRKVTDGDSNVLNTDWVELRMLTGR